MVSRIVQEMLELFWNDLDEKRRHKAVHALFESHPVRSVSMLFTPKPSESASANIEESESASAQSKEEEIVKVKPSQLPLMNQVRHHSLTLIQIFQSSDGIHSFM